MKRLASLRIFKSYLSFVLLSLLLIIPIYFQFYQVLKEREYSTASTIINNGMTSMKTEINSLLSISQTTNSDIRYRKLFTKDSEANRIVLSEYVPLAQVQDNFSTLVGMHPLISDAAIYFNDSTLLTRRRSIVNYSLDFYGTFFSHGTATKEQWEALLKAQSGGGFLPMERVISLDYGGYDAITYVCAWPPTQRNTYTGIFFATMEAGPLLEQLVPLDLLEQGSVRLYDSQGALLIDRQSHRKEQSQILSAQNEWLRIEVDVPDSLIEAHLAPVRRLLTALIGGAFLASLALALFFVYRNTQPIRKLVGLVSSIHTNSDTPLSEDLHKSEFDYIASAVTHLNNTTAAYAETIQTQKQMIKNNLFGKALGDGLHNTQLQNEFSRAFPEFPKRYQLASFSIANDRIGYLDQQAVFQMMILGDLAKKVPSGVYLQLFEDNSIILLLPVADERDNPWEDCLKALHSQLTELYDLDFCVALSECFEGSRSLADAYSQLRGIVLSSGTDVWRADGCSSTVRRVGDFAQTAVNLTVDFTRMQQLYTALMVGDDESAQSMLSATRQTLHNTGYIDAVFIKQVFYNFRNVLLGVKVENCDSMLDVVIPLYDSKSSIREVFDSLSQCASQICEHVRSCRENSKASFSEAVCRFILDNITNQELYAKMAANHFGISETTLQKIVRGATNKTFFEYVEGQRLEMAYDLLRNTALPVNSIAARCGFASPNSFYKAFKRSYGQSPGSIRGG